MEQPMKTILSVQHINKSYGSLMAVNDLSLEIQEGEIFGFLGPNGAGKTTTIQLICGLLKPDNGQIIYHINGNGENIHNHYHQIGLCPQEIILWERLTCFEQLQFLGQLYKMPKQQIRQRALQLLEELDLMEKKDHLAKTLSGGMKRRLNIAMALIHDPKVVILDEPEAGLDPQSKVKVRNYIHGLAQSRTVILTTHNMDEADRLADRIAIIDHGKLLVLDTPQSLKHQMGEGDRLDITLLSKGTPMQISDFSFIQKFTTTFQYLPESSVLSLHILNGTAQLPGILESIKGHSMYAAEIHIRENTLEDVFIQLTGRRLRE
jgi:ABC-2 type transport system ATP-binding protein